MPAKKYVDQTITKTLQPGIIVPEYLYRLDEIQARLGAGQHVIRLAARADSPLRKLGSRKYCMGRDVISHILEFGKKDPSLDDKLNGSTEVA